MKSGIEIEFLSGPRDGQVLSFEKDKVDVGRDEGQDLILSFDRVVSRAHAIITRNGDSYSIEDLGSSHGTLVDGKRIKGSQKISSENVLCCGHTELMICSGDTNQREKVGEAAREIEGR